MLSSNGSVATFNNQQVSDWLGRPDSVLCSHFEQFVDERNLLPNIRTARRLRLSHPGHAVESPGEFHPEDRVARGAHPVLAKQAFGRRGIAQPRENEVRRHPSESGYSSALSPGTGGACASPSESFTWTVPVCGSLMFAATRR